MGGFDVWLARSPLASALKIAAGAGLAALLEQLTTSSVSPVWVAVGAAIIPVLINYLNPADARYGRGLNRGE